ncbi:hypothetical protein [Rickettsiella massiliensis]|uniref:hypothetical protein n=1 Tax=Rickettsiella massiliensis TaxID=676517 RepID=UPI00178C70D1|nr:hypothetical protein [Rickettsiella massiliensis]
MPKRLRIYMILGLVAMVLLATGRIAFSYYYRYRMASFTPKSGRYLEVRSHWFSDGCLFPLRR